MTIDLTPEREGFALPLPAIGHGYNCFAAQTAPSKPSRVQRRKLNFLSDVGKPFFQYRHALYSADFARTDGDRPNIVAQRDRSATSMFIDSGGFGFIGGAVPIADIVDLRREALVAQERLGDAGVIVDVPTACIDKGIRGADTFDKCLDLTLASIDYAQTHRSSTSSLRLLNMIQGRTNAECRRWYDAVADAGLDGFGFAGARRKNIELVLELLVMMIRDKKIDGRSWFHVFGTNHPGVAIFLTAIQRELRKLFGEDVRISFDSSTSFRYTQGFGQLVVGLLADGTNIRLTKYELAREAHGISGAKPWPFDSPIGRGRTIGDFLNMTAATGADRQKWFDTDGAMMLANHSVYAELAAIIQANRWFDMEHGDDWQNRAKRAIPYAVHAGVDRITEVFQRVAAGDFEGAISHAQAGKHSLAQFGGSVEESDDVR
jgi:hypothetical protein